MGTSAADRRIVTADPAAVDDTGCTILHVDMDAFFAAVELRRHPDLVGRPMMVAGESGRSVVLSATYEARRFGVRSAMPIEAAKRLCPGIAVVPPDHREYAAVSRQVMNLFAEVTPLVEPLSVDEAFLDVAGARRLAGRPADIAVSLRRRISQSLGLTATVGVAATKFLAKLASGLAKPDGLLVVPPADAADLLRPLPIRALWGVGPRTAQTLVSSGLSTVGEIADADRAALVRRLGAVGGKLHDLANGLDARTVEPDQIEASIGAETTFEIDTADPEQLRRELLALAERTARRARQAGRLGRTVVLKVRFADFTTVTRSVTLRTATALPSELFSHARALADRAEIGRRRVRLLGIRLEGLESPDQVRQPGLFDADTGSSSWSSVQQTLDRVADRFGQDAVRRAALVDVRPSPITIPTSSPALVEIPGEHSYP